MPITSQHSQFNIFRVRGVLNALFDVMKNSGLICSFLMGNYLNGVDQAKMQIIPISIFIIILFFLPDTPEYWINRNYQQVK